MFVYTILYQVNVIIPNYLYVRIEHDYFISSYLFCRNVFVLRSQSSKNVPQKKCEVSLIID